MFGPGRFARSAYRIRQTTPADPSLSFVARVGTLLVGASAMTPILIGESSALLLGPLIVEPVFRSQGIGEALVKRSLEAAKAAGWKLVVLVGDEPYYARMGFKRAPEGRISLPGPVDPARLLGPAIDLPADRASRLAIAVRARVARSQCFRILTGSSCLRCRSLGLTC